MNPENGKKTYESIEIPKNLNETVMQTIASKNKEELKMRISLFCILCLLLGACSNEEMIPSTSEGGEECAFQFLLRVPGTIDERKFLNWEILIYITSGFYSLKRMEPSC